MATNQYFGAGTLIKYGGLTSPPSYVAVGGIRDVIKGSATVGTTDITTHDVAVVDRTRRKGGTLIDEGSYTFQVFSDLADSGASGQVTLFNNRGKTGYFQLVPAGGYSPAKTITFQAVIADVSDSYPMDGFQVWDMKLEVTGPKVIA